jgi:hypothetical protein
VVFMRSSASFNNFSLLKLPMFNEKTEKRQPPKKKEKYAPIQTAFNNAKAASAHFPVRFGGSAQTAFQVGLAVRTPLRSGAKANRSLKLAICLLALSA